MHDRIQQLITLGREHYNAGDYDKAESYLAQVAEQEHGFADICNMLGVIYHAQSKFEQAEQAFERALAINPGYTEAALNLAVTYDEARTIYDQAMSNSRRPAPQSATPHMEPFARGKLANMHADLGAAYAGMGFYEAAVREYGHALALCPHFVDLRVRLGIVYRDMQRHDDAIRELEHAVRDRPDYNLGRIHLGVTLFSVGKREQAISQWEAVLRRDPQDHRAAVYLRMVRDELRAPEAGSALRPPTHPGPYVGGDSGPLESLSDLTDDGDASGT
jgi:tetratricopeptide (TPR) repeat protein